MKAKHYFLSILILGFVSIALSIVLNIISDINDNSNELFELSEVKIIPYTKEPSIIFDTSYYINEKYKDSLRLRRTYEAGFKDALERLALLNLELTLKEERKTFGEMFEILYERNNIKQ